MEIIRRENPLVVLLKNPCISGPVPFKHGLFKGQLSGVLWKHTERASDLTVVVGKLRRAELSGNVLQ